MFRTTRQEFFRQIAVRPNRNQRRHRRSGPQVKSRLMLLRLEERTTPSIFGNFQIDGDLQATVPTNPPPTGSYDWDTLNTAPSTVLPTRDGIQNDLFNSAIDDQFLGGSKISDPMLQADFGSSPNKADLTRMYVGHNAIPNTDNPAINDVYIYLGFNRVASTGDTFAGFEVNQSTAENNYDAGNGIFLPRRTNGDLLITFTFGTSGIQLVGLL